jgi:GH15 family glucan-1,4-alpha-glucosidase
MPRSIILSNGKLFFGIDNRLRIRDLCFPGVGGPNHLNGRSIRFGIWVRNEFSWLDSDEWIIAIQQCNFGASGSAIARHRTGLTIIKFEMDISPDSPMLAINATVQNLGEENCEVRVFCTEQLCINESDIGDTALFHAPSGAMLHFKANLGFAFYGGSNLGGISSYSCGIKDFGGAEGTFRDAEDGYLSNHPIAQGSVDCTFSVTAKIAASGNESAWFAIVAIENPLGKDGQLPHITFENVERLRAASRSKAQELASQLEPKFDRLPKDIREFAITSVPILLGHCGPGGAIIAAVDSDIMSTNRAHYRYCWMRDGANVAHLLLDLGIAEPAVRFLDYCGRVLDPAYPAFLQKYTASGDLGATWHAWLREEDLYRPIQEDETALVVSALAQAVASGTIELKPVDEFCAPMTEFLMEFRDEASSLPLPSYDLWEERHGVHLNTACSVISALEAASLALKDDLQSLSDEPLAIANSMKAAVLSAFFDEISNKVARSLDETGQPDWTADASTLALILHRIVEPDSEIANALVYSIEKSLTVHSSVGGIARYEGDYYFRKKDEYPGNPWVITTLWLAQVQIQRARTADDLDKPLGWLRWAINLAGDSGLLAEQYHPETGEPLSVSPLTWSHAEFVRTSLQLQNWLQKNEISLA